MDHWLVGGTVGAAAGVVVACIGYSISATVLRKKPQMYASFSMLRQFIQILLLVALYFLVPLTPWGTMEVLVGGAIGMTVPMLFLTPRLVRMSARQREEEDRMRTLKKEEQSDTKEEGD